MTQNERVLAYMRERGSITQREAIWLGIYRLSARIFDLRKAGYRVQSQWETVENKHGERATIARYSLTEERYG